MEDHEPTIEILTGGPTNLTNQRFLKLCVNGRLTDLILHVDADDYAQAERQLHHIASQMYQWGFFDGARNAKDAIRTAIGID